MNITHVETFWKSTERKCVPHRHTRYNYIRWVVYLIYILIVSFSRRMRRKEARRMKHKPLEKRSSTGLTKLDEYIWWSLNSVKSLTQNRGSSNSCLPYTPYAVSCILQKALLCENSRKVRHGVRSTVVLSVFTIGLIDYISSICAVTAVMV